jgi:aminopeptidase C
MSEIERDKIRIKETAEIFTTDELVLKYINTIENSNLELFSNNRNFCDKIEQSGCTLEQALSTTYGVELMGDNVKLCKERLAGPNPTQGVLNILEKNIVCHDALTYDYGFGEPVGVEKFF